VNKDYGNSAVLVDGRVKRFMGIDFTLTERLTSRPATASSRCG
jgi:hypothetical protein